MSELWLVDIPAEGRDQLNACADPPRSPPPGTDLITVRAVPGLEAFRFIDDVVERDSIDRHNRRVATWVDGVAAALEASRYASVSMHRGVPLWSGARHAMFFGLQEAVASVSTAVRLLDRLRPERVRLWSGPLTRRTGIDNAVASVAARRGIPVSRCVLPQLRAADRGRLRGRVLDRLEHERIRIAAFVPAFDRWPRRRAGLRVLVPEYYPSHRNVAEPLFGALSRQGLSVLVLAHRRQVTDRFRSLGVPVVRGYRQLEWGMLSTLRRRTREFATAIDELQHDAELSEWFCESGVDLRTVWWEQIRPVLTEAHRAGVATVEQCVSLIDSWRPDAMVVMNEVSQHGRLACLAARTRGLPSVDVQHGVMYEHPLGDKMVATKQAVWGAGAAEILIACGNRADQLVVTGSPKYDRLFDPSRPGGVAEWVEGLLPANPPRDESFLAVYATQPAGSDYSAEERDRSAECVLRAMGSYPQSRLIIKLHPADLARPYERAIAACGVTNVEIRQHDDVLRVLAAAHVVITLFSTTGIEAMLLGRPLIQVNLSGLPDRVPYSTWGAALPVRAPGELADAIRRSLWDESTRLGLEAGRKAYLDYFVAGRDGRSAERVADLVSKLIGQRQDGASAA